MEPEVWGMVEEGDGTERCPGEIVIDIEGAFGMWVDENTLRRSVLKSQMEVHVTYYNGIPFSSPWITAQNCIA